jgi:hypothetical protein
MILTSGPQNQAILSNVGEVSSFSIKATAKSFRILAGSLYANKIRAIIREISTNAYDSHVAAGKKDTPFDVHLPNQMETYFSVRDYGVGLSHDEVTNIFTTFFESTKANSNDFVGALGLGSKSPFSYTDNFTVTTVKDGRKGIYTAFINDYGVPSIALMTEEKSSDPSGVEIRFAVEDRSDFNKFRSEAEFVYQTFTLPPVVSGYANFEIPKLNYKEKDIIDGVHVRDHYRYHNSSIAIMGNIAYPIEIPNTETNLGPLASLLQCNLELNFDIGELDFQPSREGLSYVPQTINAIKKKLKKLNDSLVIHISKEADALENVWDRAVYLKNKANDYLWKSAVIKYVVSTNFEYYDVKAHAYDSLKSWKLFVEDLATEYNIQLSAFTSSVNDSVCSTFKPDRDYHAQDQRHYFNVSINAHYVFMKNDTKIGAVERAKNYFRKNKDAHADRSKSTVFVLTAADKTKEAKFDDFLKEISSPPNVMLASELPAKERVTVERTSRESIPVVQLYETYRNREGFMWDNELTLADFDEKTTHYYLPLSNFDVISKYKLSSATQLARLLKYSGIAALANLKINGVRKNGIKAVEAMKNWVNLEDHLVKELSNVSEHILMSLAVNTIDSYSYMSYSKEIVSKVSDKNSPFITVMNKVKNIERNSRTEGNYSALLALYGDSKFSVTEVTNRAKEITDMYKRYPLLASLRNCCEYKHIAAYIDMIDEKLAKE